jgi:hypothetical protein
MRVQPLTTMLEIEKPRLPHFAITWYVRSPRKNPESKFSQS